MQCNRCENELILVEKQYVIQLGAKTIILENTPMLQCKDCYKEYINNNVAEKIGNIEDKFKNINIKLAVMDYKEI